MLAIIAVGSKGKIHILNRDDDNGAAEGNLDHTDSRGCKTACGWCFSMLYCVFYSDKP